MDAEAVREERAGRIAGGSHFDDRLNPLGSLSAVSQLHFTTELI